MTRINEYDNQELPAARFWRWSRLVVLAVIVLAAALYFVRLSHNPPGFFIDESSIAYNAHTISQTGRDEWGNAWPLFFRAFDEYKNPTYIYFLAAIYRVTGPSILAARVFSAAMGILTALALGWLGFRISGHWKVGLTLTLMSLLTPWLFELSRVVLEVAIYPFALTLFLLCLHRAVTKSAWTWSDVLGIAATLALLTYSYSIGRLLAPLLALGLIFFITRARLRKLLLTWALYALSLLPLFLYNLRNPGALGRRFRDVTYLAPQDSSFEIAKAFVKHYAVNINPLTLFTPDYSKVSEVIHIYGAVPLLASTGLLLLGSAWLLRSRIDRWWCFIIYGFLASIVPASLTLDFFHMLRLCTVPVFLLVLTIPALTWLVEMPLLLRRVGWAALIVLTVVQGSYFQVRYYQSADDPRRHHLFDAVFPEHILPTALAARPTGPIYLADAVGRPGYIQSWWYGTLQGIPLKTFSRLAQDSSPPEGGVVISTAETFPPLARRLMTGGAYLVYIAVGKSRVAQALPDNGFKASLTAENFPSVLTAGRPAFITVGVKNESTSTWYALDRGATPFSIGVGNHWLDRKGNMIRNDDGRATLLVDLRPGEQAQFTFAVNAPQTAGEYFLELDMLQESVSWFGLKGSPTLRLPVRIE